MTARRQFPKPRLTTSGRQRKEFMNDAPRALVALSNTQVPRDIKGPAMRGAWARGWCDGVRGRKALDNPYNRAGSGWQHGMAGEYAAGWQQGKRLARVEDDSAGMSVPQYERYAELRERTHQILRGEIVSTRRAVKKVKT